MPATSIPDDATSPGSAAELHAAFDRVVRDGVQPVTAALAALYAVYAAAHAVVLPPDIRWTMVVTAAISSVALALLWFALTRRPVPAGWGHRIGALVAGTVLANSFLHLALTDDPRHTTNLALVMIGAGCFFLSVRWLAVVVAATLGGWGMIALRSSTPGWLHFGFMLLAATTIAAVVHAVRLRVFGRLERLHQRDLQRQRELERAVEAVRQLNVELERRVDERTAALEAANRQKDELLRRADAARAGAEAADRTKDEFLAVVSHELRTPLSPVLGWVYLLRRQRGNPTTLERGLDVIERNARLEARLIDDLLDVSRITAGRLRLDMSSVDLREVTAAAVETVAHGASSRAVRVAVAPCAEPLVVAGDPMRLQQVVWNLVSNAVKFSGPANQVDVTLAADGHDAVLTVEDRGVGIPPELIPEIFDLFRQGDSVRTRAIGGLGLGLAIAKRLVDLHGGSIRAESAGPGQGARFVVRVPLAVSAARPTALATTPRERRSLCVLVVDDSVDTLDSLCALLEAEGHRVATAPSAEVALRLVDSEPPDVLVSDLAMPGIDGYELLRRVRGRSAFARLPAIAVSGFASDDESRAALAAGFDAFLAKPVEPERLFAVLHDAVRERHVDA